MRPRRTLSLRRETLAELATVDLARVAGAAAPSDGGGAVDCYLSLVDLCETLRPECSHSCTA